MKLDKKYDHIIGLAKQHLAGRAKAQKKVKALKVKAEKIAQPKMKPEAKMRLDRAKAARAAKSAAPAPALAPSPAQDDDGWEV